MPTVIEGSIAPIVENGTHLAQYGVPGEVYNLASNYLSGWSTWQMVVTVLLMLVAYDQCTSWRVLDNSHESLMSS
jgi:hypothetical protein